MDGISLDEAALISMIFESLLYGSRPKSFSSCLIAYKLRSGIYTVMFGFTLWVLIHKRIGRINMGLLLPTLGLYALATAVSQLIDSMPWMIHLTLDCVKHLTVDAYRSVKAFTTYRDAPGGPIAYFTNISSTSNLLRCSFYILQTLLADSCMVIKYYSIIRRSLVHDTISQIYRYSVVWQHNMWMIILPILLWISCAGKWATLWIRNKGWN